MYGTYVDRRGYPAIQDSLTKAMQSAEMATAFTALTIEELDLVRAIADHCHRLLRASDDQMFQIVSSFLF